MGEPLMIKTDVLKRNPFPGIRPYSSAEDKLFFGRDEATSDVVDLLQKNKFVALVGASASGKTSLIQAGVIPALLGQEKQEWIPISICPGTRPVENLVRGFQKVFPKKLDENDIQAFLSENMELGDLIKEKGLGSHSYFLVIDQFEELFRATPGSTVYGKDPGARRFIDLLVNAVQGSRPSISVLISIRSDFIEASSAFRSLTELMNKSKYFLPQMSIKALESTINGPVEQYGASVEKGFVALLLDDLEGQDQALPRLQHALMRTWDAWYAREQRDKPITISDYQSIGDVKSAIADHLEELYIGLNVKQKALCERLFKSITARSDQNNGFKREATLGNIARIAHCTREELIEVIDIFSRPGRIFLRPGMDTVLASDTVIEISHESMIKIWGRLQEWVDEEHASIGMYMKLSHASALYQQGRTELWKNPDLQQAINWRESQKPTPAWGVQYNPAFERAMVFLNTSEEELQWEEERKVILQKRRLLVNRLIAIFLGVVVVVLGTVYIYNRLRPQPVVEETPAETVIPEQVIASSTPPVTETEQEPEQEADNIINENNTAVITETRSPDPEPEEKVVRAPVERPVRQTPVRENPGNTRPVVEEKAAAPVVVPARTNYVSLARDVAGQSMAIEKDPELQGLLAYQAYKLNKSSQGLAHDRNIYNGLYAALKKLVSPAYNIYPSIRSSVKDVAWLSRTGSLLMVSSDGSAKILSGSYADKASQIVLAGTGLNNESLAVSPDEKKAAVGTNGGGLVFMELENQGSIIHQDTENGKIVLFLKNLGNTGKFISAGTDNQIHIWDYESYNSTILRSASGRLSALTASEDGVRVAYGTRDGKLIEFKTASPGAVTTIGDFGKNHVRALAYSPSGDKLVVGLLDGSLRVLSGNGRSNIATLTGPGARVADLAYSPDGRFVAAASHDGKVYLWSTADWSYSPMVFDENNGFVLAVCFSKDSRFFYSGSVDFPRFIGRPSESASMANEFCSLLNRNLTQAEWSQYIGNNLPYEKTCPDNE